MSLEIQQKMLEVLARGSGALLASGVSELESDTAQLLKSDEFRRQIAELGQQFALAYPGFVKGMMRIEHWAPFFHQN